MKGLILSGGAGTRLRPITHTSAKPLVPVAERPILELILRQLTSRGFKRIDLSVGHLGGLIKAYLDSVELPGVVTGTVVAPMELDPASGAHVADPGGVAFRGVGGGSCSGGIGAA